MESSASIAQEYYKVQDLWDEVDKQKDWRLAIWSVQYQDLDIVDKFMEIERSPLGKFEDIFFRFETEYRGNEEKFEEELYNEYLSWFDTPPDKKQDIMAALQNDGMLKQEYKPNKALHPSAANLWKEMLHFKSCVKDLDDIHFCVYIPPTRVDGPKLTSWFQSVLYDEVPQGIRLVTIDYKKSRKIKIKESKQVVIITPALNMEEAIKNEMAKGCNTYNEVSVEERFSKQINIVMECTVKKNPLQMNKEVKKLLSLSKETGNNSSWISGLMIASQAYYATQDNDKSEHYADMAIEESEKAMQNEDVTGYAVWKAAVMLKAAVLSGKKKRKEAIEWYEKLAVTASKRGDAYYVMEGYRMSGFMYYELGETNTAFETNLLALAAGNYLEKKIRRESTFIIAANLAYHLCEKCRPYEDLQVFEAQLEEWLGEDWKGIVLTEEMKKSKQRRKASVFSVN